MGNWFSQFFPPAPKFTESSLPSLSGKVYIVTGASAGVGRELARLLYSRNGTVYLAARNASKTQDAIDWIKSSHPDSTGSLHFLKLDLNDLEGIKPAVDEFLGKEKRLDVLFNNAGVMIPPKGSKSKQGYDMSLGTNCIAPFLFTKLLTPLLIETARTSPAGDVRVVWVSSFAAELVAKGGVDVSALERSVEIDPGTMYGITKGGNVLHAQEYRRRYGPEGVVSIVGHIFSRDGLASIDVWQSLNPGNLKSELQRNVPWYGNVLLYPILNPPVKGAYTELFAGLSPEVPKAPNGSWVVPWGRIVPLRKDYVEERSGVAFWEWCEKQVERYA